MKSYFLIVSDEIGRKLIQLKPLLILVYTHLHIMDGAEAQLSVLFVKSYIHKMDDKDNYFFFFCFENH